MSVVFPAVTDRRYKFQTIPRNTELSLMLLWPLHTHTSVEIKAVSPCQLTIQRLDKGH